MTDPHQRGQGPQVSLLGAGIMGSAMARNLIAHNLQTMVWDRSASATDPLLQSGALVAATPDIAVQDSPIVITMLPTADVVNTLIFDGKVAEAFSQGAVWAQMGTIGIAATTEIVRHLGDLRPDVLFVDAPVSGSKGPA